MLFKNVNKNCVMLIYINEKMNAFDKLFTS